MNSKVLMMVAGLCLSMNALAAADVRSVTVSGNCTKRVEPDRGTITLIAEFNDKTAQSASKKAMETYEQIRAEVKKMKLKDLELQTSNYSVAEDIAWENNKQVKRGFRASLGLQVSTSEISRLGDVLALSSTLKINRVENLSTYLSAKKSKEEREACLVEAIGNAKSKAEKMTTAASAKVGSVLSIDETDGGSIPTPRYMAKAQAMSAVSDESSIAPGIESQPETVTVNVQVRFAIQ